jgi:UDP-N-acetylmuramoylalanine-D-glutamate ligase
MQWQQPLWHLQIRKATIRESLSNFQGVEHRIESIEDSECTIYQ